MIGSPLLKGIRVHDEVSIASLFLEFPSTPDDPLLPGGRDCDLRSINIDESQFRYRLRVFEVEDLQRDVLLPASANSVLRAFATSLENDPQFAEYQLPEVLGNDGRMRVFYSCDPEISKTISIAQQGDLGNPLDSWSVSFTTIYSALTPDSLRECSRQ